MKDSGMKTFWVNLRTLFTTNIRKELNRNAGKMASLERDVKERTDLLGLMEYYACHEQEARHYAKELEFLRSCWNYCNFPYYPDNQNIAVETGFDVALGLPFVVHKNKKLYFPKGFSKDDAAGVYLNYLQVEKLLGVEDAEGTPHQYQSPNVQVEEGDVVFDIGAAEGLFALDQIDKASRVVIVESASQWREPLRHTFAPYGEKVAIVEKLVSAVDTDGTVSLGKLLLETDFSSAFIKMDIEGCELSSLMSAADALRDKSGIKMAVASYHRQHDAYELGKLFDSLGYSTEFSNGYMLFNSYDVPEPPFFRKGILRAKKNF